MPKVYLSQSQRDKEAAKNRIRKLLKIKMAENDLNQADVAKELGLTQPAVSKMIRSGGMTVVQLIRLSGLLKLNNDDFNVLLGG